MWLYLNILKTSDSSIHYDWLKNQKKFPLTNDSLSKVIDRRVLDNME